MPDASTLDLIQPTDLDERTINTIRFLAVDAVEKANSGHPGMPMGAAPMAYVLWSRHLRHNPTDPHWVDRDRFVLSAGHGSMLLYALLHLTGYDLSLEEIKNFRQWDSLTPGHPEVHHTPGVETTTGPLGQGFGNGVGMAIAERYLAAHFNDEPGANDELIDHYTYGIVSDGDLMEGVASEAASLAGHLGLGKLIYLYDDNEISIDGSTDLAFTEDVQQRFEAYDWHVITVEDGNDLEAIDRAIIEAKAETDRPSLIEVKTHIGYGSPNQQNTAAAHGSPLGADEVELTKENLGWEEDESFYIPDDVLEHMRESIDQGAALQAEWNGRYQQFRVESPEAADRFDSWMAGELPDDLDDALPDFEAGDELATRKASGKTLSALVPVVGDMLIGGSADLSGSNKTEVDGRTDFQKDNPGGQYFRFGVREHAMAAAANGMALHGGVRPYVATFLIFSDYLRPSLRLSALMEQPVIYVFTHDSIGLGEDGPTHQPIEHLAALRAIPNVTLFRPADAAETAQAWVAALRNTDGPTAFALTRQTVPTFDRSVMGPAEGVHRGGYILSDDDGTPDIILMGSGSEVQHAVAAADTLRKDGINVRVISMPSFELFDQQDEAYRNKVLPPEVTARVSIEAGVTYGWERFVGPEGRSIGINRFGSSAPGSINMEKFGFTPENVVGMARDVLNQ
ncbi:transketolase [Longibacter salinarum]|uniref:Transketolase n=1 Tax=Longibacter salinarum TaxID=1850348 RepID=A0A2A8CW34_9BACT|nr:transketolase [Longibacter salinarum]PEN12902.1 transketolase [Longibacter salinarum]